jgi:DNA-binding protein HU-beta
LRILSSSSRLGGSGKYLSCKWEIAVNGELMYNAVIIVHQGGFMTKADLIEKMAKDADIAKAAAEKALHSFIDGVKKSVRKGEKVALVGFGTFSVSKRAARNGRNPQTGETIKIKASKVPKFKAGKGFKDSVK